MTNKEQIELEDKWNETINTLEHINDQSEETKTFIGGLLGNK